MMKALELPVLVLGEKVASSFMERQSPSPNPSPSPMALKVHT